MPINAAAGIVDAGRRCGPVAILGITADYWVSLQLSGRGVRGIGGRKMGASSRVRMRGPMTEFRAGFAEHLVGQGYTDLSTAQQLRLLARVSEWLVEQRLEPGGLEATAIETFLAARRRAGYTHSRSLIGLEPILTYLRAVGAIPTPTATGTPAGQLIESYRRYLLDERGLVPSTVAAYVKVARRFIDARCGKDGLELGTAAAADVAAFVVAEGGQRSVRSGVVTGLRCLLRFLFLEGLTATDLASAIPAAAGWSGASLPRDVAPAQVAALLASCDRRRGIGRRDFALITLIVRLGLRAGEAAALSLDDIDWRSGDVTIRGKGRRDERLPLPGDVGEAIVAYLRRGRPACVSRTVFIRARAPLAGVTPCAGVWRLGVDGEGPLSPGVEGPPAVGRGGLRWAGSLGSV
jgi:site-specific recombinase XerD